MSSAKSEHARVNGKPLFKPGDYLTVRRAMDELPMFEKLVIEMRFFQNLSVRAIARYLRIDWDEADALIQSVLPTLRRICMSDPNFSRCERGVLALLRAA